MANTDFDMSIDGVIPPLANGDALKVYVDVENITNGHRSDTLELHTGGVDDSPEAETDISLDAGESKEYTLRWIVESVSSPERRSFDVVTTNDVATGPQDKVLLRPYDDTIRVRTVPDDAENPPDYWIDSEAFVQDANDVGPDT